jgi:hypothetical protein
MSVLIPVTIVVGSFSYKWLLGSAFLIFLRWGLNRVPSGAK